MLLTFLFYCLVLCALGYAQYIKRRYLLRDALQQRYPVVGVIPITQKQYRAGVSEI